jgi:hypothetical protein
MMQNNDVKPVHPSFKFSVFCSALLPRDASRKGYFKEASPIPSLHVIGNYDKIVTADLSLELAGAFTSSRILKFEGGHRIPTAEEDVINVYKFILEFC